jgi:hypothetical protein
MEHYAPTSLYNIIQVTEYVLQVENEHWMKEVIDALNSWYKMSMTGATMLRDMTLPHQEYKTEFNTCKTSNGNDVSSMTVYFP